MHRALCALPLAATMACGDPAGPTVPVAPVPATLAVGAGHACRLSADEMLRCWGRGSEGQLGRGGFLPAPAPPDAVFDAASFRSVVAGRAHTCALDDAGAAWCWGANDRGQLGVDSSDLVPCGVTWCSPVPAPVVGGHRFSLLAAGDQFTCGLEPAGGAWCWGLGDAGQLGQTITGDCGGNRCSLVPLRVQGTQRLTALTAGFAHVCGLAADGAAICWGLNDQGQLGRGDRVSSPAPRSVSSAQRFVQVSAGGVHTCALTARGAAWCWGADALGAGPAALDSAVPVAVVGGGTWLQVEAGRVSTCAIRTDRLVDCWGTNLSGEMGFPEEEIHRLFPAPRRVAGDRRFETIAGKYQTYCATDAGGEVWCWGAGAQGQLGSGTIDRPEPVRVPLSDLQPRAATSRS
ncbi:MAG: RCC1 domain-containing protein [Gemmatimonadota bacterium]